ncbi:MAG: T9SS type A sorting domain-containing protein [Bacteroidota bacterium]
MNIKQKVVLGFFLLSGLSRAEVPESKVIRFQENKGQISDQFYKARPDVLFSGNDAALVFHLMHDGISYQLSKTDVGTNASANEENKKLKPFQRGNRSSKSQLSIYRLDLKWLNCNTQAKLAKGDAFSDVDNFYLESCPSGVFNVKSYASLIYQNLYKGIDLKWYTKSGHLKYDYLVAAGADYHQIQLAVNGAERLSINAKGQLCMQTPFGELLEEAPIVLQNGKTLKATWEIHKNVACFHISNLDMTKPFVIDPMVRLWATYYGGSGFDWIGTAFTDHLGNVFSCGGSTSNNLNSIATVGAFQTIFGGGTGYGDSFLAKFNSAGVRQWGTYFGGNGSDFANCCVVDANGDVYMSGGTTSTNTAVMTTPGCQQSNYTGGAMNAGNAFLAKFNSSGQRLWSTYYGEVGTELTYAMSADFQNDVYIVGMTGSTSNSYIASAGAHQTNNGGGYDAFLAKYNSAGSRLWSTFYGGNGDEYGVGCITDPSGNVYMGGITSSSTNIATAASHQSLYAGGIGSSVYGTGDAFLVKFNSAGVRQWGTYYGGSGDEYIYYLAADQSGAIYFSGATSSAGGTAIATPGAMQTNFGGGASDAMFGKFNSSGQRQWATYYGGLGDEDFACCFADVNANAMYFSGTTSSVGGTVLATPCAYQTNYGGGNKDAYLAKFNYQGARLWATYYGATGDEDWTGLTVDALGNVYLTAETSSSTGTVLTSNGAHQTTYGGGTYDGLLVKFDPCVPINLSPITTSAACKGEALVLQSSQSCAVKWYSDATLTNALYTGNSFTTNVLNHDTIFYFADVSCGLNGASAAAHVTVLPGPNITVLISSNYICKGEKVLLIPAGAINYTWTGIQGQYSISVSPSVITVYTVTGNIFNGGCTGKATVTVNVNDCIGLNDNSMNDHFDFNIYPNPSNGSVTLSANSPCSWRIINELGEEIAEALMGEKARSQVQLKLPAGVYLVQAYNDQSCIVKKLIVTNGN